MFRSEFVWCSDFLLHNRLEFGHMRAPHVFVGIDGGVFVFFISFHWRFSRVFFGIFRRWTVEWIKRSMWYFCSLSVCVALIHMLIGPLEYNNNKHLFSVEWVARSHVVRILCVEIHICRSSVFFLFFRELWIVILHASVVSFDVITCLLFEFMRWKYGALRNIELVEI